MKVNVCDLCDKRIKDPVFYKLYVEHVRADNYNDTIINKDICSDCYKDLKDFLENKTKKWCEEE